MVGQLLVERFTGSLSELKPFFRLSTCFDEDESVERAIKMEEARGTDYWVAKIDDTIVGFLGLYIDPSWEMRELYPPEIIDVAVLQEHRRHNIGRQLVERAVSEAKKSNSAYLWVMTGAESHRSLCFYLNCGFHLASVVPDQMGMGFGKAWLRIALR